jgi:glycosyltransferase involved in cell wall biosynthesis
MKCFDGRRSSTRYVPSEGRPAVSVLLPCYLSARWVAQAIESVRAQEGITWEIIAIDNASPDNTYELIRAYADEDDRIRAYRNPSNIGPVANWRRCANLARYPLAGFLFSDDWYGPGFLRAMSQHLSDRTVGFAYSAVRIVNEIRRETTVAYSLSASGVHDSLEYLRGVFHFVAYGVPLSPGCSVMRTADLERWLAPWPAAPTLFDETGAGPDVLIYLRACREYPRFGHIREPMVNFRSHDRNISHVAPVLTAYNYVLKSFYERDHPAGLEAAHVAARLWLRSLRTPQTFGGYSMPLLSYPYIAYGLALRALGGLAGRIRR